MPHGKERNQYTYGSGNKCRDLRHKGVPFAYWILKRISPGRGTNDVEKHPVVGDRMRLRRRNRKVADIMSRPALGAAYGPLYRGPDNYILYFRHSSSYLNYFYSSLFFHNPADCEFITEIGVASENGI
jgi:hypothetical protein